MNHVKAFLVREFGKYFIFKFSLLAISPTSVWYLTTCSTVDQFVSLVNLVKLGTFHPWGSFSCHTYCDSGDTKLGLWRPMLRPFWASICSTMLSIFFCPPKLVFFGHLWVFGLHLGSYSPLLSLGYFSRCIPHPIYPWECCIQCRSPLGSIIFLIDIRDVVFNVEVVWGA